MSKKSVDCDACADLSGSGMKASTKYGMRMQRPHPPRPRTTAHPDQEGGGQDRGGPPEARSRARQGDERGGQLQAFQGDRGRDRGGQRGDLRGPTSLTIGRGRTPGGRTPTRGLFGALEAEFASGLGRLAALATAALTDSESDDLAHWHERTFGGPLPSSSSAARRRAADGMRSGGGSTLRRTWPEPGTYKFVAHPDRLLGRIGWR